MLFEWDQAKSASNAGKHGIVFDEIESVFIDPLIFSDRSHSEQEERFVAIGIDEKGRILSVVFTRPKPETIRIISARKATPSETQKYADWRKQNTE